MSKKTTTCTADQLSSLLASVDELAWVVRSKDEALAVLQALVDQQAERIADLVEFAAAPVAPAAQQAERIADLNEAILVLKSNGFEILTEVKVEAGTDESGQRLRTFRNPGRYEVALVLKRQAC